MGGAIIIMSSSTSTEIPRHKTSQKKKSDISKQHSKQAIRKGKSRKITKCLLTPFFITPGINKIYNWFYKQNNSPSHASFLLEHFFFFLTEVRCTTTDGPSRL